MPKVERRCQHCGRIDLVFPAHAGRPFCSYRCSGAGRRTYKNGSPAWTDTQIALVRGTYATADLKELAQELGRSVQSIRTKAESLRLYRDGITEHVAPDGRHYRAKYEVNEGFFEEWSPAMAYVLGFILADGHISRDGLLQIAITDKDLLEAIRDVLGSNHPIREQWQKLSKRPIYILSIRRAGLTASLERYGLGHRKTYDGMWPECSAEYLPHLVRGFFDGDGNVAHSLHTARYSKRLTVRFTSAAVNILLGLRAALSEYNVVSSHLTESRRYVGNWTLHYGSRNSIALYHFMYSENDRIYLARKKERFEEYQSQVRTRKRRS